MTDGNRTNAEVLQLLAAGGMHREVVELPDGSQQSRITLYRARHDPAGADRLGRMLTERLGGQQVGFVVTWEDDLVLAHVVARELGAVVAVAFDDGGIARLAEPLAEGATALILADAFRSDSVPRTLSGLITDAGAELVAACALVSTETLAGLDPGLARIALVDEGVLASSRQAI